jgi:hypothetical protein
LERNNGGIETPKAEMAVINIKWGTSRLSESMISLGPMLADTIKTPTCYCFGDPTLVSSAFHANITGTVGRWFLT